MVFRLFAVAAGLPLAIQVVVSGRLVSCEPTKWTQMLSPTDDLGFLSRAPLQHRGLLSTRTR